MNRLSLLLLSVFSTAYVFAQDKSKTIIENSTLERLNAEKIKSSILFRLENIGGQKKLTYEIDPRDEALNRINTSQSHLVNENRISLATTGTSFNILFDFFNPLKYSYKIDEEEVIDPSTIAYESFYNSLIGIVKTINDKADLTSLKTVEVSETIQKSLSQELSFSTDITTGNNNVLAEKIKKIRSIQSPELIDWALWYYRLSETGGLTTTTNRDQLDSLVKRISAVEKIIYEPVEKSFLVEEKDGLKIYYESYIAQLFEDLRNANSFEEFDRVLTQNKKGIVKLNAYNQHLEKNLANLKNVYFSLGESDDPLTNYFLQYTVNKLSAYFERIQGIITSRSQLLGRFQNLMNDIDSEYITTKATSIITKPHIIMTKLGVIKEVRITLTERNYTLENGVIKNQESKLYNFLMHVYTYNPVIAEFGLGTLLFPSIKTHAYISSRDTVSLAGSSNIFYAPAASLNLIPNLGKGQAYWMIQIAVGTSVDTPCVALGSGVRIYSVRKSSFKNFSVIGGVVSCFVKQLNQLVIDSPATAAELSADLHFEPVYRPYVGIQINF